jgi:hypothetical protein
VLSRCFAASAETAIQARRFVVNPIMNYASVLEIVFALNAMTYFYSIEPRRRGELLGLFREFQQQIPDFSRRDREAIRGYVILAHYGVAHFCLTAFSLLFAIISVGLMLYGAVDPGVMVSSKLMVPGVLVMLTLVPFGSLWLTFVCRTQFQNYLSGIVSSSPNT